MIECVNVPITISTVVTSGYATLHELDTVYGLEDVYDILEIISVNAHNRHAMNSDQD